MGKRIVDEDLPTTDAHAPERVPARQALMYRQAFMESITEADVRQIMSAVVALAKDGDLAAARLILDRVCGSDGVANWLSRADVEQAAVRDEMLERLTRFG